MWPWSKFAELEDRIANLEARPVEPKMYTDWGRLHCHGYLLGDEFLDKYRATHSEVIRAILKHLDLELVKTSAVDPSVKVEKKAPPTPIVNWYSPPPATKKRK